MTARKQGEKKYETHYSFSQDTAKLFGTTRKLNAFVCKSRQKAHFTTKIIVI